MITIERKGKNDSDFEGLLWALQTKAHKDSENKVLKCALFEAGWITCTDGERMHSFGSDYDIQDGVYEIKVQTKKLICMEKAEYRFPDIDAVYPREKGWNLIFQVHNNGDPTNYVSALYRNTPAFAKDRAITYDIKFVKESYISDDIVNAYTFTKDGSYPLIITSTDKIALIMPKRV